MDHLESMLARQVTDLGLPQGEQRWEQPRPGKRPYDAVTMIVPRIEGWMLQMYGYSPGSVKVNE